MLSIVQAWRAIIPFSVQLPVIQERIPYEVILGLRTVL